MSEFTSHFNSNIFKAIDHSVNYLKSTEAMDSIKRDPYWPKWDSPWWHMMTLFELGKVDLIPKESLKLMAETINRHYLPIFPIHPTDVPENFDGFRKALCFCALGSMYQCLTIGGISVEQEIPWIVEWFQKYQLSDGGYNCDEAGYLKTPTRSSIVSTLVMLEALLLKTKKSFSEDDFQTLFTGAKYLVELELFKRRTNKEVIDPDFFVPPFPAFYEYDISRGMLLLLDFCILHKKRLSAEFVLKVIHLYKPEEFNRLKDNFRSPNINDFSYNPVSSDDWSRGKANTFPLLDVLTEQKFAIHVTNQKLKQIEAKIKALKDKL